MESSTLRAEWGRRLRRMRKDRGLSQTAIAAKAGVDSSWYARIERGEVGGRGIGDEMRIRIAAAFGERVEDLFPYPDTTSLENACPSAATAPDGASSPTPATKAATRSPAPSATAPEASAPEGSRGNE